jgi:hypothetical protein
MTAEQQGHTQLTEYFLFLDDLRSSGITNMFGAAPYLADEFAMTKNDARAVLRQWQTTFSDEPARVRAAKATGDQS